MVLKYITYLFVLFFVFQSEQSLLELYERKITRELSAERINEHLILTEEVNRAFAYWEEYKVLNQPNKEVIVASIFTCNLGGCTAEQAYQKSKTSQEYFDILIEFTDDKITKLKVLQYFSDYGYEVCSKNYLKNYYGKTSCEFSNFNSAVDGISGATISVDALQTFLGELCD